MIHLHRVEFFFSQEQIGVPTSHTISSGTFEGDKIQFIHFGKSITCQMKEFRDGQSIQTGVKLLGIELDSKLTFHKEIEKRIDKVRSLSYVISFFIKEINVTNAKTYIWLYAEVN
ncbi:unnamed protein product [Ambrosiozyma monospora]|uniref:Unnamed protein product n=1 Tax=Ambrosiozyma monospora TaxID=43982 RepID=A0ACB5SQP0_AMBMO|nr:unnamed protein product [Ambrosiozyma monospora]